MCSLLRHIVFITLVSICGQQAFAQAAMPDTVCVGTTRLYQVNDAAKPSTYTWKVDGVVQTSQRNELTMTWNTPGVFLVTVQEHSNNGCDGDIRSGVVNVIAPPVPNAGPDAIVCYGNSFRLNGAGGTQYQWSPATYLSNPSIPNPVVNIPLPGTYQYYLDVRTITGCRSVKRDTVTITILQPVKVFAGRDTLIVANQPVQLNAADVNGSGFVNYTWTPSAGLNTIVVQNPVAIVNRDIVYVVTARTANGCEARDDISIKVFNAPDIFVPTGFTPNGDGLNDIFKPVYAGIRELKLFSVFSRWGELVFTTKDQSAGWNGMYKGRNQDANVFVWQVEGVDYNGNVIRRKGTVALIR
jgi:gliding motility-associated-like protein